MHQARVVGFATRAKRITLLNHKGGCGKTLIATNLASLYASRGYKTALVDHDRQGSAMHWLDIRNGAAPAILGIDAGKYTAKETRSWQLHAPSDTQYIIVDTPAGLRGHEFANLVQNTDVVLIPVLPSETDVHAAAGLIRDLLLDAGLRRSRTSVGVVGNRVRTNTRVYDLLKRFLSKLEYPLVGELRDTQNYVRAAEQGLGIHEVRPPSRVRRDIAAWTALSEWIDRAERPTPRKVVQDRNHGVHAARSG
jgi:chromosome partitioning protein